MHKLKFTLNKINAAKNQHKLFSNFSKHLSYSKQLLILVRKSATQQAVHHTSAVQESEDSDWVRVVTPSYHHSSQGSIDWKGMETRQIFFLCL